ncbi:hypothetical protein [Methylomonas methanica]|uniref:Uncharacterized protein n=1 Tax=Methylomonas methanica (strain DSM 25384 / MC09) TaxID=857087 RepID=G0A0C4_METMM|nr:hypothetical protein [Methylomonas methanica]AEG02430.1 hypothetical protein Metme_4077 [Methylomonas methanica MC09]
MKKNKLTKAVLAALVFASSSVLAGSDYPAADFQPKVLFSDESAQSAPESKPAAAAVAEEADPNFPAANFQPKVLFKDSDYKHSAAAPSSGSSSKSSAPASAASAELDVIESEKAASSDFSYIGLIALAAIGFVVYSKKAGGPAAKSAADNYVVAGGATGVEKYLEKMGANKTGVAKYLEKQTENPSTGVAKYMAKQIVKDREAAAARATGVEKYLRDKG